MESSVVTPLIGKHVTSLVITPLTVTAATGALTEGTPDTITRGRTNIQININPQSEEINDDGSVFANHVTTHDDWSCSIDLLPLRTSAKPFKLLDYMDQYEYFMVDFVVSAAGSTYPVKLRGKRGDLSVTSGNRGKFTESLNLMCIDCGTGADASLVIG